MAVFNAVVRCMLLVTVCFVNAGDTKRVLMMPAATTSHTKYHTHIGSALVDMGHEVWVWMSPFINVKNVLKTEGLKILEFSNSSVDMEKVSASEMIDNFLNNASIDYQRMNFASMDYIDKMLRDEEFIQKLRDINLDLIVIDNVPFAYMMTVLAYKLDKPFAYAGSAFMPFYFRVPYSPAAFPMPVSAHSKSMTFTERLVSFSISLFLYLNNPSMYSDAVSRYAPERPYISMQELIAKAEISLAETDHIMDYPQPTLPNVIRIGGTSVSPAKPLKEPFQSFVESAKHGVLMVTLGSYVVNLPDYISTKMIDAFRRLKFKVIWRVNMTSPDPEKIMTSLWIPQNDLLAHPSVKVFLSHCGKNGQYEALYHAVPLLCLPMFGDQPYNAERTRIKGWSLTSDLKTVTSDDLVTQLNELHDNTSYKDNIKKGSEIFKVVHGLPVKTAAFWLDHVMNYGGGYMRYEGQEMPAYRFYCLDLMAFFITVAVALFIVLYCLVSRVVRFCRRKVSRGKDKAE